MSALRKVGSWANDQESSEGEGEDEEFGVDCDSAAPTKTVQVPNEERLQYRANASSVNSGRNKDGFNSNSNNYYGGNHRRGDRDQNRDGRSYGNNRDHNNPNYRRKGSGEYRPNHDRNANHAYRQKQQGNIDVTTTESSQLSNPAPERPKLELKPRTTPLETEPSRDPNIFGIGKAREYQEDPMIQTLDLNDRGSNGQTEIDKEMAVDSQNRAYTNKSNLSTDKRFSQDRFKGGGRGNLKGRDKKSKNSEDGGKSNHTKTFETQNRRSGRAQYPSQPSSAPENTPSRAESLRKANPFGALDESSSEEDD